MTDREYAEYMARVAATPDGVGMSKALCDVLYCPHCARLTTVCDADTRGCGTTPAKEESWRDRPPLL